MNGLNKYQQRQFEQLKAQAEDGVLDTIEAEEILELFESYNEGEPGDELEDDLLDW